jgi:hypothetical protein
MRTDTSEYEFNHGRKPKGRALWAFELTGTDGQGRYTTETIWIHYLNYGPAKRAAVKQFKMMVPAIKEVIEIKALP